MKNYIILVVTLLWACGDNSEMEVENEDSLASYLTQHVIVSSQAVLVDENSVSFTGVDRLVQNDSINGGNAIFLKRGNEAVVTLELIDADNSISHAGIQFGDASEIWIIPLISGTSPEANEISYSIERPPSICDDFIGGCQVSKANQYAVSQDASGSFFLSNPVEVEATTICGDCLDNSCDFLGNLCFANEEDPNPSVLNFMGVRYDGGASICQPNAIGLFDYIVVNGLWGVNIFNGATSGTFKINTPLALSTGATPQELWVSIIDGLGQSFVSVSGSITFSANTATYNLTMEDANTVFDANADHAANRFKATGKVVCTN